MADLFRNCELDAVVNHMAKLCKYSSFDCFWIKLDRWEMLFIILILCCSYERDIEAEPKDCTRESDESVRTDTCVLPQTLRQSFICWTAHPARVHEAVARLYKLCYKELSATRRWVGVLWWGYLIKCISIINGSFSLRFFKIILSIGIGHKWTVIVAPVLTLLEAHLEWTFYRNRNHDRWQKFPDEFSQWYARQGHPRVLLPQTHTVGKPLKLPNMHCNNIFKPKLYSSYVSPFVNVWNLLIVAWYWCRRTICTNSYPMFIWEATW